MSTQSAIEWTEATWNPITGCTKISAGCKHCYAERMALRLRAMGQANYANGFEVTLQRHMLERPLEWKRPLAVFVNSMSDLFHERVPDAFIDEVFDVMRRAHWHVFQVLTKRADRLAAYGAGREWPSNVWVGVSVESARYTPRIEYLRQIPAAVRFLSLEPLLGPINALPLEGIDWVIVGGESGPRARPMKIDWVESLRSQCVAAGTPFFFKQWGGWNKKRQGRVLNGQTWDEMPSAAHRVARTTTSPS